MLFSGGFTNSSSFLMIELWTNYWHIKRCCLMCRHLLLLLTKGSDPFIVGGSHSTITACTLPTWIPGHIVDSMNRVFGSQLRRELIDFMSRSEFLRPRAPSTGSQRLSLDSSAEDLDEDREPTSSLAAFRELGRSEA